MRRTALALAGLVTALALVVPGAALAADGPAGAPFGDRLAAKLGVSTDQLRAAVKAVLLERVDAALAAGRITPQRAAALKQRIEAGQRLGLRVGQPGRAAKAKGVRAAARVAGLKSAADLLGLSLGELRQELRSGTSLAELARAKGISTDALVTAMLKPLETRLTQAVTAGRITAARKAEILAKAQERLAQVITKSPAARA